MRAIFRAAHNFCESLYMTMLSEPGRCKRRWGGCKHAFQVICNWPFGNPWMRIMSLYMPQTENQKLFRWKQCKQSVSRKIYGHNRTKSQHFQVQLVTCCDLSIFFIDFMYISWILLNELIIFLKSSNSTNYFLNSIGLITLIISISKGGTTFQSTHCLANSQKLPSVEFLTA